MWQHLDIERDRYRTACAALEARIQGLSAIAHRDLEEALDAFPSLAPLHEANYEARLAHIRLTCTQEAGMAVSQHEHYVRVTMILAEVTVPPFPESGVYEEG
ncbi:hypothetical protein RSAG8_09057, partial [Rhizoctonia solani AG-8 WAC10335]